MIRFKITDLRQGESLEEWANRHRLDFTPDDADGGHLLPTEVARELASLWAENSDLLHGTGTQEVPRGIIQPLRRH